MNFLDLAHDVSDELGYELADVTLILRSTLGAARRKLLVGESITLRGIGKLEVSAAAEKNLSDNIRNRRIVVPERWLLTLRVAQRLRVGLRDAYQKRRRFER